MIIYTFGSCKPGSTVLHRVQALNRLGHSVVLLNPCDFIGKYNFFLSWLHYRTGYRFVQSILLDRIRATLTRASVTPDVLWVDSGEYIGPRVLKWIRNHIGCRIILYCNDDPTGPRDWIRYASLRRSLPYYDLCVYRREVNELEWLALGARKVLRIWMSYDESIHRVRYPGPSLTPEVLFIGTNINSENRGAFLASLVKSKIPLTIYGSRWQRSAYWKLLRPFVAGGALADIDYAHRLGQSALCLGMLSKHNRDLHTRRSVEVPAAGGTLIAERTSEHQLLFEESVEALFWSDEYECITVSRSTLNNSSYIQQLMTSGHERVLSLGVGNEDICSHVLSAIQP